MLDSMRAVSDHGSRVICFKFYVSKLGEWMGRDG